jgi:hypothetical protein
MAMVLAAPADEGWLVDHNNLPKIILDVAPADP